MALFIIATVSSSPAQKSTPRGMDRQPHAWDSITLELLDLAAWLLDRALLHVHAWRVSRDPAVAEWVQEIDRKAADGTLADDAVDRTELRTRIDKARAALG